jgi:hypothetical protein
MAEILWAEFYGRVVESFRGSTQENNIVISDTDEKLFGFWARGKQPKTRRPSCEFVTAGCPCCWPQISPFHCGPGQESESRRRSCSHEVDQDAHR